MPIVAPLALEQLDAALLDTAQFFKGPLGMVPNSLRTMAHRPAVAHAFVALNRAVMTCDGQVTPEQKRLIGFIASLTAGCRYCQAHTALGAQRLGASEARLQALWSYQKSPLFSPAEKVAFDFAIAAASVPNAVSDEIAANLRNHWNDGEIVEILSVIAMFGFLNRWNDAMGTTLEEGGRALGDDLLAPFGWIPGKHA